MTTTQSKPRQSELANMRMNAETYAQNLRDNNFRDKTVDQVLAEITRISDDAKVEKGTQFEKLTQWALPLIKDLEITSVKKPRSKDIGIDLVAIHVSGYEIAIQCKFHTSQNIRRNELLKFADAAKQREPKIKTKWLVCGAKGISDDAKAFTREEGINIIDLRQYQDTVLSEKPASVRTPLPLQQEAIDAVLQGYQSGADRGRLIMACGTGKTFTALRIVEQIAPAQANILFIAPSIALVAQARNEWLNHSARDLRTLVVCSDNTASYDEDIRANEIACRVTTDPLEIAAALKHPHAEGVAHATFCTYQSLDKLAEAQAEHGAPQFDFAVVDEAHRTTGLLDENKSGQFQIIHDNAKIKAAKRLYMTATPRIYKESTSKRDTDAKVIDMSDAEVYGNQFYHLTFQKGVEAGMLCDYRVIALGVSEAMIGVDLMGSLLALNAEGRGKAADEQAALALGAISLAINGFVKGEHAPGIILRTIAFASNIRRSKWLAAALNNSQMKGWITKTSRDETAGGKARANKALQINAKHLDGTSSALQRQDALHKLGAESSRQQPRLITNAKLFTEGVDVPALNAIAFLDPRTSKIDTVQAVGRVMRHDPKNQKTYGYIIVPIILPADANLLDTLTADKSRFKSLGNILRALQSHDERLVTDLPNHLEVAELATEKTAPGEDYNPDIQQSLLTDDAKQALYAQIANHTGLSRPGKRIADAITIAIEQVARIMENEGVTQTIANTIGTPSDNPQESCKTAALLIANACIMHRRLEETGNLGGLTKIEFANNSPDPCSVLYAAWLTILQKDYSPIFQDATELLKQLSRNRRMDSAMHILMECAINNAATMNDLGFDHAGPLYHRVLGTAASDGAFFTKNLSAYLLAGLAFDNNFTDWSSPEKVRALRIADPACGTGTLLMAALNVIKRQAKKAQNLDDAQIEALHKHLVEKSIHGFDINKYSVQLAACNLTIGAPNTDYNGMNLHTLQHGPLPGEAGDRPEQVRHGALEILLGKMDYQLLQQSIAEIKSETVFGQNALRKKQEFHAPSNLDAIIYNPPFTDTQLQGDRFKIETKLAMDTRLKQIKIHLAKTDPAAEKSIGKRSIGPYFTPLAHRLLSPEKGTLAKIIPTTACTSANGNAERQYHAANYHIAMVVTSHDPRHVNFSENTAVHECLVIARRHHGYRKPTRFIQLAAYPQDTKAVEQLVDAIHNHSTPPPQIYTPKRYGMPIKSKTAIGRQCNG